MFIGRQTELAALEAKLNSETFELGILYGRRRIGKTTLLKALLTKHPGLYYVANEMGLAYNLKGLSHMIAAYFGEPVSFTNFEDLFTYLCHKALNQPVRLIIDEFTYLFAKEPGVASILQNIIDTHLSDSNLKIILSGSQVGMIEDVISYRQPLYGRATFTMQLKAFDYYDAAQFYQNYSPLEKIMTYGVFGGIPYYLNKIDDAQSLKQNIIRLILEEHAPLAEETAFFLKQELRSIASYSMIIHAISTGATRLHEIVTKARIQNSGTTTKYIRVLSDLGIITKEVCFGEGPNTKKTLYKIDDHFFNFYYRFVHPYQSQRVVMKPDHFYDTFIAPKLDDYIAGIFEKVAMAYLIRNNRSQSSPAFFNIGRYWGHDTALKRHVEIDLVTQGEQERIVYECKWTRDLFKSAEVHHLIDSSRMLNPNKFGGFAKSGFSKEAAKSLDYTFTPEDLFNFANE